MEDGKLHNIIPLGNNWASMPIGATARISALFALWPKPVPKFAAPLLSLLCEKIQKANLFNEGEQIGVEVSSRALAKELTPPWPGFHINQRTITDTFEWLKANEWIFIDKRKGHCRVVTINTDMIKQYAEPSQPATENADTAVWQEAIDRAKEQEAVDRAENAQRPQQLETENAAPAVHHEVTNRAEQPKKIIRPLRRHRSSEVADNVRRLQKLCRQSIESEEVGNV